MKRYPEYKESGVDWVGEIPINWSIKKLKFFSRIVLGKMLTNEDKGGYFYKPYLRAQNINWFNVNSEDIKKMWFSENELSQYRIKKDDLLVSEGGEVGRTCMWNNEIDECYIQNSVHKVTVNGDNVPRFFQYFFYAIGAIGHFDAIVSRVSIAHLTREKLKEVSFFVPDQKQQTIIATFLDHKTRQIDDLIAKKQKLIELLREERTGIINQAVTKGLDPNVPMKDPGIEWLGEIPEHWSIRKLKYSISIKSGDGISNIKVDQELPKPIYGGNGIMGYTDSINSNTLELIIGRVGALCGNVYLVDGDKWISDNALRLTTTDNYEYMYYLLQAMNLNDLASKTAQPLITGSLVKSQYYAVPPLKEQQDIVNFISLKEGQLSETIRTSERQIELMTEYKTSLINEAVTGKIDVRDYQINHA